MPSQKQQQPYKSKRKFKPNESSKDTTSPSNKKRALKQARQAHRPHSEVVISAKDLWNKLRVKTNTSQDIEQMMLELMELLRGKFNRVALQHDASRVVQAAIQFGNKEQRGEIVKELCDAGNIVELAKSQYSHFVVLKMIKYCKDDKGIDLLVKSFKGHISKLAVHAVGARVIELLFATFPAKSTTKLKLEVYGPRFTLFNDSGSLSNTSNHPTLKTIIKDQPKGKEGALESLLSIINKGIDKGLFSFAYFQELLCEYVTVASSNDVRSLCSSLVDHSIHLLSTKAGSRVVAECAAYGTPKDRKRIMKSLKGYTRSSLLHADAYIAILRLLDVTDDTVTVQKSILAELQVLPKEVKQTVGPPESDDEGDDEESKQSPLLDIALSDTGSKMLLLLLAKDEDSKKRYFDPAELEILRPNPTIVESGTEVATSKKNPKTRRTELLQYMKKLLVELSTSHTGTLLRSRCGSRVLREVHANFPSKELSESIANACENRNSDEDEISMFECPIGHLSLKGILANESGSTAHGESSLAHVLCEKFGGKLVKTVASSNRGAFVLAALADVEKAKVKKDVSTNEVKKLMKTCKKEKKPIAGYEALLKVLQS